MMKIKSLLLATMALAITADAAANVEMSIFKKKKAYEIENLVVVEKGQTNGVAADQ